jgi:hypothetical protein
MATMNAFLTDRPTRHVHQTLLQAFMATMNAFLLTCQLHLFLKHILTGIHVGPECHPLHSFMATMNTFLTDRPTRHLH